MKTAQKNSGFTLVELLMVVVILAVCATVILPLMSSNTYFQLQAATRDLDSIIQYTQNLAITSQQPYKIVFDSAANEFAVSDESDTLVDDPGKTAPSDTTQPDKYKLKRIYSQDQQYSRVSIAAVSFDGTETIWFDSLGVPHSGDIASNTPLITGEITLTSGNYSMKLTIEPVTGKIKIQ
ncbi:MAG: prepilin-type N-terminal cleavage/methylation domain-containing protein [Sedimentisphaerales bacterium]|nr:prepilin-type N-terminal cleavage/methylation domain-containing protein [Sedimentisphaerales bacterium]